MACVPIITAGGVLEIKTIAAKTSSSFGVPSVRTETE